MACAFPWFKFYAADWETDVDVCMMTLMQKGIYISLLAKQWIANGIPDDKTVISWLIRLEDENSGGDVNMDLGVVLKKFPPHPHRPGYLANPKLLQLYETNEVTSERRAQAGAKGGRRKQVLSKRKALAKQSPSLASQSESESESETTTTWGGENADQWFAKCWDAYPKRPGNSRKAARTAWDARLKTIPPPILLAKTEEFAAQMARDARPPDKIKMAATFYGPSFDPDTDYGPVGVERQEIMDDCGVPVVHVRDPETGEWKPEAAA